MLQKPIRSARTSLRPLSQYGVYVDLVVQVGDRGRHDVGAERMKYDRPGTSASWSIQMTWAANLIRDSGRVVGVARKVPRPTSMSSASVRVTASPASARYEDRP